MVDLVSPGTQVNVFDDSFFIPGRQATVPLIFIATADEKTQADGVTPALGTYENNVVRTVTNSGQAAQLYGTPRFMVNSSGAAHHGDARNEYGLDALYKYLDIGERAYVVRADVNLDDTYTNTKSLWTSKISTDGDTLNQLVADFIEESNAANGLVPASPGFKQTVTGTELKTLIGEAIASTLASYSFSSTQFEDDFLQDHTVDLAGYTEVVYDSTGGNIVGTDATGLNNDSTAYSFQIEVVDNGGTNTFIVAVTGSDVQTFAELTAQIQSEIQGTTGDSTTLVELISGNIRITSGLAGATSSIDILSDDVTGSIPLFGNTNLFLSFSEPVSGQGPNPLDIYDDTFSSIVDTYDGIDAIVDNWSAGAVVADEFTSSEAEGVLIAAASDFDNTLEFRNSTSLGSNDAARRASIVQQIQAAINNPNSVLRTDQFEYNLVCAPGYWEATDELLSLAQDQLNEVFVIGDTPVDRAPTGPNGMVEWANDNKVFSNLVAYFYPHGLSSNTDGAKILTSAASTALRLFALNDRDAELWYAVAGPQRAVANNLDSIGYVTGNLGTATTFVEDNISRGIADTLFPLDINYFTRVRNRGIVLMSQNTTQSSSTQLDRVNVSRLVAYIRREIRGRVFDLLYEPNDGITRQNAKSKTDSFLSELVGRRALFDFATRVDGVNNAATQIANSELVIDIAIKPVTSTEFVTVNLTIARPDATIR